MEKKHKKEEIAPSKDPRLFYYDALLKCVDGLDKPESWKRARMGDLHSLNVSVGDFLEEQGIDAIRVQHGDRLYKDFPKTNSRNLPMRKQGFIDAEHSIEYQISQKLSRLVSHFKRAGLSAGQARGLHYVLREYVEALHNEGICLTQGKQFASSATMPVDPEHADKDPQQHVRNVFFDIDKIIPPSITR